MSNVAQVDGLYHVVRAFPGEFVAHTEGGMDAVRDVRIIKQELIMKEVRSNTYSLNLYFVTKLMVELPGVLIPTWISSTIVYFVVGL